MPITILQVIMMTLIIFFVQYISEVVPLVQLPNTTVQFSPSIFRKTNWMQGKWKL